MTLVIVILVMLLGMIFIAVLYCNRRSRFGDGNVAPQVVV
jgi:hypothetical protein